MKVLVDARAVASGRGVARYASRMLEAVAAGRAGAGRVGTESPDWHAVLPADDGSPALLPDAIAVHRSRLPSRVLFGLGALTGRPRLDAIGGGADAVWLPTVAPVSIGRSPRVVVTIHDLSFLHRPADFTAYERAWHRAIRLDRLLDRAAAVVCDTAAVAAEVHERWPALGDRVHVVVPGVDRPPRGLPAPLPHGLPKRFFLLVGALEPRKAPEITAAAYAAARAGELDAGLVVAGSGRLAHVLDGPGIHHVGRVDDATLHALYGRALAVVMPSWLEGFGLPPLEAALHGTPSILSDLPVFAETLGDGALRTPPGDVDALAAAMLQVAGDAALRTTLATAGAAAATPLTWARAATGLTDVLTSAVAA